MKFNGNIFKQLQKNESILNKKECDLKNDEEIKIASQTHFLTEHGFAKTKVSEKPRKKMIYWR